MPDITFNKNAAIYVFRRTADDKKMITFAALVDYIKSNPAYLDPHSKIYIDEDAIYFGHSLMEIEASFTHLSAQWRLHGAFDESNLSNGLHFIAGAKLEVKKSLNDIQGQLCADAEAYFKELKIQQHEIPQQLGDDANTALLSLIQQNQGVIIGESDHGSETPKKLVIDNMQRLKELGVTTLFLEHVFSDTQLELFEAYFKSETLEMPVMLKNYLSYLDCGHLGENHSSPYSFTGVVIQAKLHGIKIIPIDTYASYAIKPGLSTLATSSKKRALLMNYVAAKQLQAYQQSSPAEKYVVFCGSMHINAVTHKVPGITECTGLPTIVVERICPEDKCETISTDNAEHIVKPDVLIKLDVAQTQAAISINEVRAQFSPTISGKDLKVNSYQALEENKSLLPKPFLNSEKLANEFIADLEKLVERIKKTKYGNGLDLYNKIVAINNLVNSIKNNKSDFNSDFTLWKSLNDATINKQRRTKGFSSLFNPKRTASQKLIDKYSKKYTKLGLGN